MLTERVPGLGPRNGIGRSEFDLSASMMCADVTELGAEARRLEEAKIDSFHFDIMDGHFVPNLALNAEIVRALRPMSGRRFDIHLMVDDPGVYVSPLADAGCDVLIFHIEACPYPRRLVRDIERYGMVPGIALNPATSVTALESIADIPYLLLMTVEPGFAGQNWIANSPDRIRRARHLLGPAAAIVADGHIDLVTAPKLAVAGASGFVCGTKSVFGGEHAVEAYAASLCELRGALRNTRAGPSTVTVTSR